VRITRPFYLGKYEVTQDQWQTIMSRNPSYFKNNPENPVDNVSWDNIQPFLSKLNEATPAAGVRFVLPTEAQWEYACRAGTTTYWHCGDEQETLREYDWVGVNSVKHPEEIAPDRRAPTHPVGQLKPNPFGLCDLHGNVNEWCTDWQIGEYSYYAQSPIDDPPGPSSGYARVYRGGCSHSYWPAWRCRSAWRGWGGVGERYPNYGFRLVGVLPDK